MQSLQGLNDRQKEAAAHQDGPLLVLAGAGAGKTKTVTHRILGLIEKGVSPSAILAVTFTNKAAKEMRERMESMILKADFAKNPVSEHERPFLSTFHSLGVYILRHHGKHIGISQKFKIIDKDDAKKMVRDALRESGYDIKQYEPNKILGIISKQKGDFISPDEYNDSLKTGDYFKEATLEVWRKYEKRLKENDCLDFDDLLVKTVLLLRQVPQVREYYNNKWKYIHIDEYQDTNKVQYEMAMLLVGENKNICAVGDIDQNIYSWRGATIKNIMHFEHDFPGTKIVLLEENYRSTARILSAANTIIAKNKMRKEKNLFTRNHEGEKITLYNAFNETDEASFIARKAKKYIASGTKSDNIAVLYRANFQSRALEEACLKNNVPYQVLGTRFFERKEIKDLIAYVLAAKNNKDLTSLGRIINSPTRGIGKVTYLKICEGQIEDLPSATRDKVRQFYRILDEINKKIETVKPHEVFTFIIKSIGLEDILKKEGEDGIERLENVRELVSLAKRYEELPQEEAMDKLLDDAALASDQDELNREQTGIKLMTVHASKGLEFDVVFISGLEQGLFPHNRFDEAKEDEEEERRLFYVAVTRARNKLVLSYAGIRTIFGSQEVNVPSEFIYDIDDADLENAEGADWNDEQDYGRGKKEYLIDF